MSRGANIINKALNGLITTRAALNKGIGLCNRERVELNRQKHDLDVQITTLSTAEGEAREVVNNITALLPKGKK